MASAGPSVLAQQDFSAGMWRSVSPELIPRNGVWDLTNGLLDETGAIYRRGGSTFVTASDTPRDFTLLWDGYLAAGQATVAVTANGIYRLNSDGTLSGAGTPGLEEPGRAVALNGVLYLPGGATYDGTSVGAAVHTAPFYAAVAGRLLAAEGDTVAFSAVDSVTFDPTDFHRLPGGVRIVGMEGLRDSAAVFTTDGVWLIQNLTYNLTDDAGNVQQRLDRYSDLRLWGDAGIAQWQGGLVVPATDGVWLMSLGVASEAARPLARISSPIDSLYRRYVRAGYKPGQARVFRGTYLLPIMAGTRVVDLLVARLESSAGGDARPWSHLSGFGAGVAAFEVTHEAQPRLLGAGARRVLDCRYFEPSGSVARDADGSAFEWKVVPRDMATGPGNVNTVMRLRARYELEDVIGTSTIEASIRSGDGALWDNFLWDDANWSQEEGTFAALESLVGGSAPEDPDGQTPFAWRVNKHRRFVRFMLRCDDAPAKLVLRGVEVYVRDNIRL